MPGRVIDILDDSDLITRILYHSRCFSVLCICCNLVIGSTDLIRIKCLVFFKDYIIGCVVFVYQKYI